MNAETPLPDDQPVTLYTSPIDVAVEVVRRPDGTIQVDRMPTPAEQRVKDAAFLQRLTSLSGGLR